MKDITFASTHENRVAALPRGCEGGARLVLVVVDPIPQTLKAVANKMP
jgi:hypothetical protein